MKRSLFFLVLLTTVLLAVGCSDQPSPTDTPEIIQATNTPEPTKELTSPTPTSIPIIPELTVVRLTANGDARDWYPIWFPDGKRILFISDRDYVEAGGGPDYFAEYYVMNADGSQPYIFTEEENPSGYIYPFYQWSPDGTAFLVSGQWEVFWRMSAIVRFLLRGVETWPGLRCTSTAPGILTSANSGDLLSQPQEPCFGVIDGDQAFPAA